MGTLMFKLLFFPSAEVKVSVIWQGVGGGEQETTDVTVKEESIKNYYCYWKLTLEQFMLVI